MEDTKNTERCFVNLFGSCPSPGSVTSEYLDVRILRIRPGNNNTGTSPNPYSTSTIPLHLTMHELQLAINIGI